MRELLPAFIQLVTVRRHASPGLDVLTEQAAKSNAVGFEHATTSSNQATPNANAFEKRDVRLSAAALLSAGATFAQTMPMKSGEPMKGGAMASGDMKMSKSETKMMHKCMAMGHEKMRADKECEAMADKHPNMMKSDGMMKK